QVCWMNYITYLAWEYVGSRRECCRHSPRTLGLGLKVVGLIVAIIFIFIIGYITGYYVHKCP
uniref:Uncharacterized protein n=1 Tax=Erpetoichthys calabaricus TaxID=27687 RepID=A0A8C4T240_ERPCA